MDDVRWAADPESYFAGYLPPEPMARHSAPRPTILHRIKTWLKRWRRA